MAGTTTPPDGQATCWRCHPVGSDVRRRALQVAALGVMCIRWGVHGDLLGRWGRWGQVLRRQGCHNAVGCSTLRCVVGCCSVSSVVCCGFGGGAANQSVGLTINGRVACDLPTSRMADGWARMGTRGLPPLIRPTRG